MGLSWQQGPLGNGPVGRFLTPEPLPQRLLFAEPLRRRMRVRFAGEWIADSEDVLLLHEPGHYPVAFFPVAHVRTGVLVGERRTTRHRELGDTAWFIVTAGGRTAARGAWQYTAPPEHARELRDRVVADTTRPLALYESGFAQRWYVPRDDIDETTLSLTDDQTFCPYKGVASYYDIGERSGAAWSYPQAWPEVARIADFVSFEPDRIDVYLDGKKLALEPGQTVVPHGIDRGLDLDEILERA
jgi:uncharacterized protein (DUF427 family)